MLSVFVNFCWCQCCVNSEQALNSDYNKAYKRQCGLHVEIFCSGLCSVRKGLREGRKKGKEY